MNFKDILKRKTVLKTRQLRNFFEPYRAFLRPIFMAWREVKKQVIFTDKFLEFFEKKNFLEFHSENSATPPKSTLVSNFCSATLAISWVLGEIWPI